MRRLTPVTMCAIALCATKGFAQESALSLAATQPAKGRITWREQARFERYELNGEQIDQFTIDTRLVYGLRKDIALTLNVPTILRDRENGIADQMGRRCDAVAQVGGSGSTTRHRSTPTVWALVAGVRMPSGTDGLSSGGWDPMIGLIYTRVRASRRERGGHLLVSTDGLANPIKRGNGHGRSVDARDFVPVSSAEEYASDTHASWYFTVESFVDYETNGDSRAHRTRDLVRAPVHGGAVNDCSDRQRDRSSGGA
ncbi:MAG: hypothetical protein R3B67_09630 [Phycisphaerales bacterium]